MLFDHVRLMVDQHFPDISQESLIYIAFSGGPDSVFLVCAMRFLFPSIRLHLLHFNHGLREKSFQDVVWVRKFAKQYECDVTIRNIPVACTAKRKKMSIEQSGRYWRYRYIKHMMHRHQVRYCLLGHHNDDRIETFLFRILKGTRYGAQGISPCISIGKEYRICRPLLSLFKHDICKYLCDKNISFLTDESNLSLDFDRNKIRSSLGQLGESINPKYKEHLSDFIDYLGQTNNVLDHLSGWKDVGCFKNAYYSAYTIPDTVLDEFLLNHLVASIFRDCRATRTDAFSYDRGHVEQVASMIRQKSTSVIQLPLGYFCQYSGETLYIKFLTPHKKVLISQPSIDCHEYGISVCVEPISMLSFSPKSTSSTAYISLENSKQELSIRSLQKGDRFHLFGRSTDTTASDALSKLKVPRLIRDAIPLFFLDNQLAWIPGGQVSERYKVTSKTTYGVCITIKEIK